MSNRKRRLRTTLLQTTMLAGIVGSIYLSANVAEAADVGPPVTKAPPYLQGPAVDGLNGKADAFGGSLGNRALFGSKGAVSIPLQGQWGAQLDGVVGSLDHRAFGHIGGHLFWRDPGRALLGAYVGHTHWDQFGGVHVTQFAAEGEYYWQRWTLQGIVGVELGNSASGSLVSTSGPVPGIVTTNTFTETYDVRTRFFDQINLKYYVTDNWNAYVGHRYLGGKNAFALGSEYAMPIGRGTMASGFLEGRVGEGQFHGIWGGVRVYFGQKDKPLIARHRQDDPTIWGVDTLFSIVNSLTSSSSSVSQCFSCDGAE